MVRRALATLGAVVLAAIAGAAFTPIHFESNEELFEIPNGTWALRRSGSDVEILPSRIRLLIKLRNVLVLRNLDDVPQIFGPTLIMPGQTLRLPFDEVSENQFVCTAHANGQLTVSVEEVPATAWERLRWRLISAQETFSRMRLKGAFHG